MNTGTHTPVRRVRRALTAVVAVMCAVGSSLSLGTARAVADTSTAAPVTLVNFDGAGTSRANQVVRLDSSGSSLDAEEGGISEFVDPVTKAPAYFLYGESHACGFTWTVGSDPYCGVNVYSSTDLTHWTNRGTSEAKGKAFDPGLDPFAVCPGWCFRPHVIYNATTSQYVMWVNHTGNEYFVLTSASPAGPFAFVGRVTGADLAPDTSGSVGPTDENLFIDPVSGAGYLIYTFYSVRTASTFAIRRLNSQLTAPDPSAAAALLPFGPTNGSAGAGVEAPALFERPNAAGTPIYYVTYSDPNCGYGTGCGTSYQWSLQPTGPFGPGPVDVAHPPTAIAQPSGTTTYNLRTGTVLSPDSCGGQPTHVSQLDGASLSAVYLYQSSLNTGSANEGQANHYWAPLSFDAAGSLNPIGAAGGQAGWPVCATAPVVTLADVTVPTSGAPGVPASGVDQSSASEASSFGDCQIGGFAAQSSVLQTFTAGVSGTLSGIGLTVYARRAPGSGGSPPVSSQAPTPLTVALVSLTTSGGVGSTLASGTLSPSALSSTVTPGSVSAIASTLTVPMTAAVTTGTHYGIVVSSSSTVSSTWGNACYGVLLGGGYTGGQAFTNTNANTAWTAITTPAGGQASIRFFTTVQPATSGPVALVNHALGSCAGLSAPAQGVGVPTALCSSALAAMTSEKSTDGQRVVFTLPGSLCLDIAGESLVNGAPVVAASCSSHDSQAWTPTANADGTTTLRNMHSGRCLDVSYHLSAPGTAVVQGTCTGSDYQEWALTPATNGVPLHLVNNAQANCAVITSPGQGTPARTGTCSAAAKQYTARLVTESNGDQRVTLYVAGRCVDVANESTVNGTPVVSGYCTGHASQSWTLVSHNDNTYTLRNANSGKCVDIADHSTAPGTAVVQGYCTGAAEQNWRLSGA